MNTVYLEYLNDYSLKELQNSIENAFQIFAIRGKIKTNTKVLIKVCLSDVASQDMAETTNPALVRVLVDSLTKIGAKCYVADSPLSKYSEEYLSSVYLNTGMLEMANLTKCELNNNLRTCNIEIENGIKIKNLELLNIVNDVDVIINVGKLKFDNKLGYLGSTANIFGLVPGGLKSVYLNRFNNLADFNDLIIDINETLKDKTILNILDGVVALEANKTQRMFNCLAVSDNSYALDASIFDILGIKYESTLLKQAQNRNLFDFSNPYKTSGKSLERFKIQDFAIVETDSFTEIVQSKRYFKTHQQRPVISKKTCKGCQICSKICPTNAILMKYDSNGELYAEIDYSKCIFCKKCITACPYGVVKEFTPHGYKKIKKEINKYNT